VAITRWSGRLEELDSNVALVAQAHAQHKHFSHTLKDPHKLLLIGPE
jgi:hypothetical protein